MIARNNLVAAAQNIQGAQRYLTNVEFPYCSPSEVGNIANTINYQHYTNNHCPGRDPEQGDCLHLHGHADHGAARPRRRVLRDHGQEVRRAAAVDQHGQCRAGYLQCHARYLP